MRNTAIVIPCYNEESRLPGQVLLDFARQNPNVHFLLVNDCSRDGTGRILDELCGQLPRQMAALHLPENLGKAGAVRAGFLQAFAGEYVAVGYWDADLATPLAEITQFGVLLEDVGYQMVIGSRVRLLGRQIERQAIRHYLGRIFATLASLTLGVTIYDTQCGAKIFANTPLLRQIFAQPFTVGWVFDVELLARYMLLAKVQGAPPLAETACEYPLKKWVDVPGTKLKVQDFGVAIWELAKIWQILHGAGSRGYVAWLRGTARTR